MIWWAIRRAVVLTIRETIEKIAGKGREKDGHNNSRQ